MFRESLNSCLVLFKRKPSKVFKCFIRDNRQIIEIIEEVYFLLKKSRPPLVKNANQECYVGVGKPEGYPESVDVLLQYAAYLRTEEKNLHKQVENLVHETKRLYENEKELYLGEQ